MLQEERLESSRPLRRRHRTASPDQGNSPEHCRDPLGEIHGGSGISLSGKDSYLVMKARNTCLYYSLFVIMGPAHFRWHKGGVNVGRSEAADLRSGLPQSWLHAGTAKLKVSACSGKLKRFRHAAVSTALEPVDQHACFEKARSHTVSAHLTRTPYGRRNVLRGLRCRANRQKNPRIIITQPSARLRAHQCKHCI